MKRASCFCLRGFGAAAVLGAALGALPAAALGGTPAGARPAYPLHTAGRFIVDAFGHRVPLHAVSWYGAESKDFVVAGLQTAPLAEIAAEIKELGFNAVRLPWSNELVESNPVVGSYALSANPELEGKRALEIYDRVVATLTNAGLMVILDNHNSNAEWCCNNDDGNTLWYNAAYPESSWIADWKAMAARYRANPAVIGADLRNEPRGNEAQATATWGGSPSTDWHAAAVRGGNAVLEANPHLLIIVEGVGWAGDLSGVAYLPVTLNSANHVVYEAHDYGFWRTNLTGYDDYLQRIQDGWGYLATGTNPQPLWIGEFGTCNADPTCVASSSASDNGYWFGFATEFFREHSLDWSYWAINGTQSTGSGRVWDSVEAYGILNTAWNGSSNPTLTAALQSLIGSRSGPANGVYKIVNAWSGLAMGVSRQSTLGEAAVDQSVYSGGTNQQWKLVYVGNGMYWLANVHSGLVLDVKGQSSTYGDTMVQRKNAARGSQQFVLSLAADGNYLILNAKSGLAVEDPGFSSSNGTVLDQWGLNGGSNQEWQILAP